MMSKLESNEVPVFEFGGHIPYLSVTVTAIRTTCTGSISYWTRGSVRFAPSTSRSGHSSVLHGPIA